MGYIRLTDFERNTIAYYYNEKNCSLSEIARILERNVSTISREIKRNKNPNGYYDPSYAQALAVDRRSELKNRSKFSPKLKEQIEEKLYEHWSPERICCWYRLNGEKFVTFKTIYRYVKKGLVGDVQYLRRKGVPYKRQSEVNRMRGGKSIHDRSSEITNRERLGDWEVDTVVGPKGTHHVVVTLVDRKSRILRSTISPNRKSKIISKCIVKLLENEVVHSITADNGTEFAGFRDVEQQLDIPVYFADPYCSWQRGTNENTNGLLREFIPKGLDIKNVNQSSLNQYVNMLNRRPRKVLGFNTPEEVYFSSA